MFTRLAQLGLKRSPVFTSTTFRSTLKSKWTQARLNFRFQSTNNTTPPPKKASGIKALIQEYGYSALGVYLAISAIDLPLCFLMVHSVGADQVREYQRQAKNQVKSALGWEIPAEDLEPVKPHEEKDGEAAGFWSNPIVIEAVLAYAIHKSLVFIRVPITAGVTPSVVKLLRGWGFKIGKQPASAIAVQAKEQAKDAATRKIKSFGVSPSKKQKWWSWFF